LKRIISWSVLKNHYWMTNLHWVKVGIQHLEYTSTSNIRLGWKGFPDSWSSLKKKKTVLWHWHQTQLNSYLEDKSYLTGFSPSPVDLKIFRELRAVQIPATFPNLVRWFRHIESFEKDPSFTASSDLKDLDKRVHFKDCRDRPLPELKHGRDWNFGLLPLCST